MEQTRRAEVRNGPHRQRLLANRQRRGRGLRFPRRLRREPLRILPGQPIRGREVRLRGPLQRFNRMLGGQLRGATRQPLLGIEQRLRGTRRPPRRIRGAVRGGGHRPCLLRGASRGRRLLGEEHGRAAREGYYLRQRDSRIRRHAFGGPRLEAGSGIRSQLLPGVRPGALLLGERQRRADWQGGEPRTHHDPVRELHRQLEELGFELPEQLHERSRRGSRLHLQGVLLVLARRPNLLRRLLRIGSGRRDRLQHAGEIPRGQRVHERVHPGLREQHPDFTGRLELDDTILYLVRLEQDLDHSARLVHRFWDGLYQVQDIRILQRGRHRRPKGDQPVVRRSRGHQ